jgi:hypothetical protein
MFVALFVVAVIGGTVCDTLVPLAIVACVAYGVFCTYQGLRG